MNFCPFYAEKKDVPILATGSEKGIYYAIGQGIANVAEKSNIRIKVLSSQGSVENLYWLSKDKAQLCIAQSDTVYNAYNGLGKFTEKMTNIQAIASLYTEAVHILVRKPLYITKIENFKGKRISIGPEGSGTESNALAILGAAGITPNEIQLLHLNFEDSIRAINENKVDIVFITSGYPSDVIKIITENRNAYFFEPNSEIISRLINTYPYFVVANIPAGTYANQDEDITTIGVEALLVGRNDLDNHLVYTLTKLIFDNRTLMTNYQNKNIDINLRTAFKGITIPIHAGAEQFYNEKGFYKRERYKKIADYMLVGLIILLFIIILIKFNKVRSFLNKRELARVFIFLIIIWILGTIILYFSEHKINENYSNLFLAFWATLVNWISFGSKEPYTFTGRVTAIAMMVFGIGGVAWLTGEIASFFVHKKLMGGKWMIERLKDHYVIINWNNKGHGIIEQLHNQDITEIKPILVITDLKESPMLLKYEQGDVYHISDSIIDESLLKKGNVHLANSVIILADDLSSEAADANSILIILAIRKISGDMGKKPVPIVVEILDPSKIKLATYAGVDKDGYVEIVSSKHATQNLIAQAAVNPGLTEIYEDLLTFGKNTNEIYSHSIPSKFIGKTVDELFRWVINLREKNIHIIPIAISSKEKIYINPSNSDVASIEDGDILFAICYTKNDLKKLENY